MPKPLKGGREPKPEPERTYLDIPRNQVREFRKYCAKEGVAIHQETPLQNGFTRLYGDFPEEVPIGDEPELPPVPETAFYDDMHPHGAEPPEPASDEIQKVLDEDPFEGKEPPDSDEIRPPFYSGNE